MAPWLAPWLARWLAAGADCADILSEGGRSLRASEESSAEVLRIRSSSHASSTLAITGGEEESSEGAGSSVEVEPD
eukprot:CAMPEP_0181191648 /NCGR_PEP_ID=MMETSP1096-20121128/12848_1 /TAXON_ID=156174 ORGANISM="Chrysochromulina ericina, Strain CCMP281" /NCGR_SAMPLE_ID=MMETSP1096 /ASSEMBLY_ACC=CAM_ASM_000453 /LENGTH=75 /DNA_ID=CAMNT_0023280963 /DNA_START=1048 /DNA_END=1276 /DNA_ORIENTATION=+